MQHTRSVRIEICFILYNTILCCPVRSCTVLHCTVFSDYQSTAHPLLSTLGLVAVTGPCAAGYYCSGDATSPLQPALTATGGPCTTGHYCLQGMTFIILYSIQFRWLHLVNLNSYYILQKEISTTIVKLLKVLFIPFSFLLFFVLNLGSGTPTRCPKGTYMAGMYILSLQIMI